MSKNIWSYARGLICLLVVLYTIAPVLIIAILSFSSARFLTFPPPGLSLQWYQKIASDPSWLSALRATALISIPAALGATALGTCAAISLARTRQPLSPILMGIIMSPLIVPSIIIAAGVFSSFRQWGLTGGYSGMILAHIMLTIPYVFTVTTAALQTTTVDIEDAARTLGAPPLMVFFRITLPMITPAILSGLLFAAVMSFDELVVSMFLSSPDVRPVTVQMWADVRSEVDPTIAALATAIFFFTMLLLMLDFVFARRNSTSPS